MGKAFHIDDPLFLKAAQQIRSNPLDFYGFRVNWYGTEQPMWEVTKNPPLGSFFIALAAEVAGWSEVALHLAFLLPAVAAALGTLALARRFCTHPLIATFAAVATPAGEGEFRGLVAENGVEDEVPEQGVEPPHVAGAMPSALAERCAAVLDSLGDVDIIVNLQGDALLKVAGRSQGAFLVHR